MPMPVWNPNKPGQLIDSPTEDVEATFLVRVKVRGARVDKDGQRRPDLVEALRLSVDDAVRNEMIYEPDSLDETDFVQEIVHVSVRHVS
jgi:hypothetical protein